MKQRKPPVFLAALLILGLGTAAIINSGVDFFALFSDNRPKPKDEPVLGPREQKLKADLVSRMRQPKGTSEENQLRKAVQPTILLVENDIPKPIPNDAEVSSLWYDDQARKPGTPIPGGQ